MTPLVLLPGMMCDARLFLPQIAAFSAIRTVISAEIWRHDSIGALAEAVLADAPARFALAGLSMGGIVAMEILRRAPERVARIALMDTNPLAETETVKARRAPQMVAVREGRLAEVMRDEMKPNYLSHGAQRAEVLSLCMEMALDLGPEVFVTQSQALMDRPDQTGTLRAATLPALVLCGRDDTLCPIARHELMAGLIPGAQLEIIDGAGHLPTLEQPARTNEALARWLED
ncbi:alpha/beta fold hydrolase [uncultured Roseobacter sp.]|uniref:alpha/beta fold hydrolase n=1 Tax=uncultured Roseobacter sp. TaxID=114847 RepID=UPI002608AC00|nr:alpha/beta fold hydrolase [uncultured Roseobacter sp.]